MLSYWDFATACIIGAVAAIGVEYLVQAVRGHRLFQ
jgi:hypothetical protein